MKNVILGLFFIISGFGSAIILAPNGFNELWISIPIIFILVGASFMMRAVIIGKRIKGNIPGKDIE